MASQSKPSLGAFEWLDGWWRCSRCPAVRPAGQSGGRGQGSQVPRGRPKSLGTSLSWVESKGTLRCCCARVVVRATKPPRKDKRLSGCAGSGEGGTPRAPPSSRELRGRNPSAKKTSDRCLQRTLLFLQRPRWWRGVTGDSVHVITVPR